MCVTCRRSTARCGTTGTTPTKASGFSVDFRPLSACVCMSVSVCVCLCLCVCVCLCVCACVRACVSECWRYGVGNIPTLTYAHEYPRRGGGRS